MKKLSLLVFALLYFMLSSFAQQITFKKNTAWVGEVPVAKIVSKKGKGQLKGFEVSNLDKQLLFRVEPRTLHSVLEPAKFYTWYLLHFQGSEKPVQLPYGLVHNKEVIAKRIVEFTLVKEGQLYQPGIKGLTATYPEDLTQKYHQLIEEEKEMKQHLDYLLDRNTTAEVQVDEKLQIIQDSKIVGWVKQVAATARSKNLIIYNSKGARIASFDRIFGHITTIKDLEKHSFRDYHASQYPSDEEAMNFVIGFLVENKYL